MISVMVLSVFISYSFSQRTQEFGIRIALGAQRGTVLQSVLREGMLFAAAGVVIGLAAALNMGRPMSTQLYNVSPLDPMTLMITSAVLLGVSFFACYIPARRATLVDPMVALRNE
jgi:ABC-type antimicrobial peptide transport system permease subunit